MREEIDQRTGMRSLILCDRAEWEREIRFTTRPDGSVQVAVLVLREGIFDTSESYLIARDNVSELGASIMAGARLHERLNRG